MSKNVSKLADEARGWATGHVVAALIGTAVLFFILGAVLT